MSALASKKRTAPGDGANPAKPSLLAATTAEQDFPRGRAEEPVKARKSELTGPPAKRRKMKTIAKPKKELEGIRVEHLNYKRLLPNTRLLVRVVSIRDLELVVALPNQLLGHIPIVNVSSHLTEELAQADDEDEDLPTLTDLFQPGQLLTAMVVSLKSAVDARRTVSTRADEELSAARRVELTLDPSKVNDTITKIDLAPGYVLSAAVKSREDKGFVLDFGITGISSFLRFKDAPELSVGQVLRCKIVKLTDKGRTVTVSLDAADSVLTTAITVGALLPGLLISALITTVLPTGLNVKINGFFDGTIDLFHTGAATTSSFKIGQKVKARVLWALPTSDGLSFALSLLPTIVKSGADALSIVASHPVGTIIESVKVLAVDREWGLTCSLSETDSTGAGFVHVRRGKD